MTTATITGPIYNSTQLYDNISMRVVFEISHWDQEEEVGLFASGPIIVPVDSNGNFSVNLFINTEGNQETHYQCFLQYRRLDGTEWIREPIGIFTLASEGTFKLGDLNITPIENKQTTSLDLYTLVRGLLTEAQIIINTGPTGAAIDAADASAASASASATARTQAELAAIAAGAKLYDSAANGLAGTVSGEVFLVFVDPGVQVYRNDTGSATLLGWLITESPLTSGAKGDGTTNDKAVIDTLNTAENVVNLAGRTYAYTGDFDPLAQFENGVIVSSTKGTFDYLCNVISSDIAVTVGAAGTFKFLKSCLDWLKAKTVTTGSVTISLLEHNTPDTSSGSMALNAYMFDHPQSSRMQFTGPALSGAVPTVSDMTGTRATDETLIKSRFNASIYLHGTDDLNGSYGLAVPNGLLAWDNIAIISRTRYSLDIGYNGSHGNSGDGRHIRFGNVAISGGVWGMIAVKASVTWTGTPLFCHQISGGPMDLIGCHARCEINDMHLFAPEGVVAATAPKYGVYLENGSKLHMAPNKIMRQRGAFLHGAMLKHSGTELIAESAVFDGVTNAVTAEPFTLANIRNAEIKNGDKANTALVAGGSQIGYWDNNGANATIHAGAGAIVSVGGVSFDNHVSTYALHSIGGLIVGLTSMPVDNCKWTGAFARFYGSQSNYIAFSISSPQAGSLDQCLAFGISTVRIGTNSGASFSPAANTTTNGNLFATTG